MPSNRKCFALIAALSICCVPVAVARSAAAREKILVGFNTNSLTGNQPHAALVFDGVGNLYGTTSMGGAEGGGAVFALSRNPGGGWTTKVLHSFNSNGIGGNAPYGALILDADGNLYGTTEEGGEVGWGTVFELIPTQTGAWEHKLLYSFGGLGNFDGAFPLCNLVFDAKGNLYGTTANGGLYDGGTVFELTSREGGAWKEKILHSFSIHGGDGFDPVGGVIFDASGNLYGTTSLGGDTNEICTEWDIPGCGAVFELSPKPSGTWTETLLYKFNNTEGNGPNAGLVLDKAGNLYGTTFIGGTDDVGVVFELSPENGTWVEKALHSFKYNGADANNPEAGLTMDAAGNLFGTSIWGGSSGIGAVFEVSPKPDGSWVEAVVFSFNGEDGFQPNASLIPDAAGNLYGTTMNGGLAGCLIGCGTVFELLP